MPSQVLCKHRSWEELGFLQPVECCGKRFVFLIVQSCSSCAAKRGPPLCPVSVYMSCAVCCLSLSTEGARLLLMFGSLQLALTSRWGHGRLLLNLRAGGANQMPTGARPWQLEWSRWTSWTAGIVGGGGWCVRWGQSLYTSVSQPDTLLRECGPGICKRSWKSDFCMIPFCLKMLTARGLPGFLL